GELPRFFSLMGSWRRYAGALVVFAHGAPRRGMRMRPPAVGAGGPGRLIQGGGPTAAEGPGGAGNGPAPVTREVRPCGPCHRDGPGAACAAAHAPKVCSRGR